MLSLVAITTLAASSLFSWGGIAGRDRFGAADLPLVDPLSGTAFADAAKAYPKDQDRQELALTWLFAKRRPRSSSFWRPVSFTAKDKLGALHEVKIGVEPDYLAVGTDEDHLIASVGLPNALRLGKAFRFMLPTSKLVDEIWKAAGFRYDPSPLPPTSGSTMRKPDYQLEHRRLIEAQGKPKPGTLVAGHKKDVVLSKKLLAEPGRLAIYGWHQDNGKPIQGLSLFHGKDYADYSHGIRPIASTVYIDGKPMNYADVLRDPILAPLVSYEGAFDPDAIDVSGPWNMI